MRVDVTFDRDEPTLIEQIGELSLADGEEPETRWALSVEVKCFGRDTPGTYWQPPESMEIDPVRAFRETLDEEGRPRDVEFDLSKLSSAEYDRMIDALYESVREQRYDDCYGDN